MSAVRRPDPTDEEMRRAWAHCRRATWPSTFEEAMAHPTLSRLVRITAMHPPRALRTAVASAPRFTPLRRPPAFDLKRAAAGDRDDD